LVDLVGDRREPLRPLRVVAAAHFGGVRVDGGFERRIFRERRGLRLQLALTAPLDGAEDPLPGLEVGGDRLPDLVAHRHGDDDEDGGEQERDGDEDDGERPDEQARWPPCHRASSTGTVRSMDVGRPASTRIEAVRSPTRSCQPTTVYSPAGTSGSSNVPSTAGIAKYGWSSTRIDAFMCEWMSQNTLTSP